MQYDLSESLALDQLCQDFDSMAELCDYDERVFGDGWLVVCEHALEQFIPRSYQVLVQPPAFWLLLSLLALESVDVLGQLLLVDA